VIVDMSVDACFYFYFYYHYEKQHLFDVSLSFFASTDLPIGEFCGLWSF
tara:strand:- start:1778 stop:1924 length:147 start_codon:yes stop_codon:yes gene_type:complete